MHVHILGICGTFMGSLAILARELGFKVSGSDQHVYPPMSTQLEEQGIDLHVGYDPEQLKPAPDLVVIGNAMTRGNPAVEYVLDTGLSYTSGPEFFARYILKDNGFWQRPGLMVKPQPAVCWPGFWSLPECPPDF